LAGRKRPRAKILLEVCVDSLPGALAAQRAGADRIELCGSLADGGITPSAGLIEACVRGLAVPVHVLVRPRVGDFRYSRTELDVMRRDVETARRLGAVGVALGALGAGGKIDRDATARLVEAAGSVEVTFHRAFDLAAEPLRALEDLIALGERRVLSSGGAPTASRGARRLRELVEAAAGRIVILPGGGIGPENAARICRTTGAREVHASCRSRRHATARSVKGRRRASPDPALRALFGNAPTTVDAERVRELARVLRGV
jgi:copper homeostasis protein